MYKIYLKTTFRNLWKNKTFSSLNIFGLAIGIACAGLIFLWVEDEINFDDVHVKKEKLYAVNINMHYAGNSFTMGSTPRPMAALLKKEIPGIVNSARISDQDRRLLFGAGGITAYAYGRYTDASLFSMFSFHFLSGNNAHPFSGLYSLVISKSAAKKFFPHDVIHGYENLIGQTVRVDNKQDYLVSGVVEDFPENSSLHVEWLAPYDFEAGSGKDLTYWGSYGPFTYVELDDHANVGTINNQLKNYIHNKQADQNTEAILFPMKDWRLYGEFENGKQTGGGRIKQVRTLSMIAWIILLIACINFMNLSTASSQKRAREVGVRKVLGAGKKMLITQFVGEAIFLSLVAAILAIFIIALSLPSFNMLMQKQMEMHVFKPVHLIFILSIAVICGLVAGSYPSLYLSSFNPVLVFKGLKMKGGGAAMIRKVLVVLQFTVSVVFIISTIIVYMQIQHVKNRDLGFNKENLIQVDLHDDSTRNYFRIRQDLLHTGVVENAAMSDHVTIEGGNTDDRFTWEGKAKGNDVSISFRDVSPEFISTSGMKIIEGRDFGNDMSSENLYVLVTKSLAKLISKESVIGKIIQTPRGGQTENEITSLTIIGVVDDYVYGNVFEKPFPVLFFCRTPEPRNDVLLYVRTKSNVPVGQALAKINAVMKKDNAAYPFEYKFVDDQFNEMFRSESTVSKVSGVFASLAIIISCLGLFGLAAYTAERRIKEIGVRKVLGASVTSIAALLSKDFLQLVFISFFIAFPIAGWIMHDWLQNYEYRIGIQWWIFIVAGSGAVMIALATVSFQSVRAARANPVKSLRSE